MRREVVEEVPQPRVMCDVAEWPKVVKALVQRHLVTLCLLDPRSGGASPQWSLRSSKAGEVHRHRVPNFQDDCGPEGI